MGQFVAGTPRALGASGARRAPKKLPYRFIAYSERYPTSHSSFFISILVVRTLLLLARARLKSIKPRDTGHPSRHSPRSSDERSTAALNSIAVRSLSRAAARLINQRVLCVRNTRAPTPLSLPYLQLLCRCGSSPAAVHRCRRVVLRRRDAAVPPTHLA